MSALRDYTRALQGEKQDGSFKVAADSLWDALREKAAGVAAEDRAPARPAAPAKVVKGGKAGKAKVVKGAPIEEADFVGSKACVECHAKQIAEFNKTLMGRLALQNKIQCESCHGPASIHVKEGRGGGGIITFRKDDPNTNSKAINEMCLGCHKRGDRTYWNSSAHEERDVACTNCHTIMKNVSPKFNLKTAFEPDTCFQCHKDRQAQMWRNSHMPMREGKIVCSDCHNPHGSATEGMLRADSINDTCYRCHAEKRGPFLFEHLPVRENCLNCHDPHGTVNEYMLKMARPQLCLNCHGFGHSTAAGINTYSYVGRSCQNCHTQVHGTNDPSGALLHR
ncbi:MAG: DmsE family decaheme c-type cytochrome [Hyphomicrobiales bacterium]|nr:DmsE family decaheme c-type cytochrome [Hyphomicrobiales bacterium]